MTDRTQLTADIIDILGPRYRVRPCTRATSEAAKRGDHRKLYAVFSGQGLDLRRVTDPMPHQEAQQRRQVLIINAILDLIEGG